MTTNITRTSADGRTSAKAKAGAEPLCRFTRENYPNSFRDWDKNDMQEGNYALAWFLREAVTAMVRYYDDQGLPNHDGASFAARGVEMAFDLLLDRMDMIRGQSPMPFLCDVANVAEEEGQNHGRHGDE